jgi:hypothetical protein
MTMSKIENRPSDRQQNMPHEEIAAQAFPGTRTLHDNELDAVSGGRVAHIRRVSPDTIDPAAV